MVDRKAIINATTSPKKSVVVKKIFIRSECTKGNKGDTQVENCKWEDVREQKICWKLKAWGCEDAQHKWKKAGKVILSCIVSAT